MDISDHFIGKLKAGQADMDNLHDSKLARVEHDGSTWFYDLPAGTTLEDFKVAAEVAWDRDADYAEIWGSEGYARVSFA
jgi:hypothetical protein